MTPNLKTALIEVDRLRGKRLAGGRLRTLSAAITLVSRVRKISENEIREAYRERNHAKPFRRCHACKKPATRHLRIYHPSDVVHAYICAECEETGRWYSSDWWDDKRYPSSVKSEPYFPLESEEGEI